MRTFIGIDLGTSGVKILLVDEKGNVISKVQREYDVLYPHYGWSEQNPEDWTASIVDGLKELIKNVDYLEPHIRNLLVSKALFIKRYTNYIIIVHMSILFIKLYINI